MITEEAAAIAVATLFGIFAIIAAINFKIAKFKLYLLVGLSCVFRTVGFSMEASYFSKIAAHEVPSSALASCYFVFIQAGIAIAFAVHIIVMTCWFKNSSTPSQPPFSKPLNMRILIRWFIAPFVTFGPVIGIPIVVLSFGFPTPDNLSTSRVLRQVAAWGFYGTAIIFICIVISCVYSSYTSVKRDGKIEEAKKDQLIFISLICILLLFFANTFTLVSVYHSQFFTDPNLYYPLVALPVLIEQAIVSIPFLLAKVGMASRYDEVYGRREKNDNVVDETA